MANDQAKVVRFGNGTAVTIPDNVAGEASQRNPKERGSGRLVTHERQNAVAARGASEGPSRGKADAPLMRRRSSCELGR